MQFIETLVHGAVDTLFVFLILLLAKKLRDARFRAAVAPADGTWAAGAKAESRRSR